ncbi:hypothetical protein D3C80_1902320 [compost metagenome]
MEKTRYFNYLFGLENRNENQFGATANHCHYRGRTGYGTNYEGLHKGKWIRGVCGEYGARRDGFDRVEET